MKFQVNKLQDHTKIILGDTQFIVPSHWFWDQAEDNWEPQTFRFFERNLICGTDFLDIGAWVGPTSMISTALGARKSKIIEPNPVNFWHLLVTQINNPELFQSWFLVNACVSDKAGSARIGPLSGIKSGSSATTFDKITPMELKSFRCDLKIWSKEMIIFLWSKLILRALKQVFCQT